MFSVILLVVSVILVILTVFALCFRVYNRFDLTMCTSDVQLRNKTVIVTGASAGIGKAAAADFAKRGARVILACRNRVKARRIADKIIKSSGNKNVHVRLLDTSDLTSVRSFAKDILKREDRLDILVLNAGMVGNKDKQITKDGLELTMATNHFGHFLLVNLLAEQLLKPSRPSRIIVTASGASYHVSNINHKDLNYENEKYEGFEAYKLSKFCNIAMTKYLGDYFLNKGVTVNCLCPGLVSTEIFDKTTNFLTSRILKTLAFFASKNEDEGAQTIIYLAVSEEVKNISGHFFMDSQVKKPNPLAHDAGIIKKIWEASEDYVKLTPEERNISKNSK